MYHENINLSSLTEREIVNGDGIVRGTSKIREQIKPAKKSSGDNFWRTNQTGLIQQGTNQTGLIQQGTNRRAPFRLQQLKAPFKVGYNSHFLIETE